MLRNLGLHKNLQTLLLFALSLGYVLDYNFHLHQNNTYILNYNH